MWYIIDNFVNELIKILQKVIEASHAILYTGTED